MKRILTDRPEMPPRRSRGRPRSFDREAALDAAMEVFHRRGFEGASLAELTEAMGINPPSLYAAFGDKEGLFLEAIRRYQQGRVEHCPYVQEPTARAAIQRLLTDMAAEFTRNDRPRGCMMVMASCTAGGSSEALQQQLAQYRQESRARLKARIERGIREGELPPDADAQALATFYASVLSGMSLQARDGASRKALLATVETAMRAWPEPVAASKARKAAA